jgi:hypothetical protein
MVLLLGRAEGDGRVRDTDVAEARRSPMRQRQRCYHQAIFGQRMNVTDVPRMGKIIQAMASLSGT